METILLSMLSGLCINVITWASGKFGLSKTYVSVGLCLLIWIAIYAAQLFIAKYQVQWEKIVWFASWAYAMSQVVYNIYQKLTEEKGKEEAK